MNADGVIYVTSEDNKIFALNTAELINPNLSVNVENIVVGDDAVIMITLNSQATGNISIKIGENTYIGIVKNGLFIKRISNLVHGDYSVNVTYNGDMRFNNVSKLATFKVMDIPTITVDKVIQSDASLLFIITLPIDATGNLTLNIDSKNYTAILVNGSAYVKVSQLSFGEHDMIVSYSGDNKYDFIVKHTIVNVPMPKLVAKDIVMLYSSGDKYKVRLTQGNVALVGKTITFIINGKKTLVKTDKNGYALFKINLKPNSKKYTISTIYNGIKKYNKITVKSIVVAKNLKVKKSAKTLKIKVSLKKVNKKYLKAKKITLKFNGKTYNAKTSKNGVVTFSIKKNVLKKLKVGKKYTYKVSYLKDSISKKITVEK